MKFRLNRIIEILKETDDGDFVIVDMMTFDLNEGNGLERIHSRIDKDSWRKYKAFQHYPVNK